MNKKVEVGYGNVRRVVFGDGAPLAFIGGPCAIESREHALRMGERLTEVCERVDISFIPKPGRGAGQRCWRDLWGSDVCPMND